MSQGNDDEEEEDELANIATPPAQPQLPEPSSSQPGPSSSQPAAIGFTPLPSNHNEYCVRSSILN